MLENERIKFRERLREGLNLSRYKLIREKALRNESVIIGDYKGGSHEVSARKLLKELYNEEVQTIVRS